MKRPFGSSGFLTVLALPSLAALTQAQSAVETKKFSFVPNYSSHNTVSYTGTMPLPLPTEGGL